MREINNYLKKRKKNFYSYFYIDFCFLVLIGLILMFSLKAINNLEVNRCNNLALSDKNKDGIYVLTCSSNDDNETADFIKVDNKDK